MTKTEFRHLEQHADKPLIERLRAKALWYRQSAAINAKAGDPMSCIRLMEEAADALEERRQLPWEDRWVDLEGGE